MTKSAHAMISWVPASKGGRQVPPAGPSYTTLVRFDDDKTWPNSSWSLVVDFITSFQNGQYTVAKVHFLVEDAPHELLKEGGRFQLYEGRRMVATGLVREDHSSVDDLAEFEAALLH